MTTSTTDRFIALFRSSAIIQGAITLCCVITMCILYIEGHPVPNELLGIVLLIVGYYFGTKTQQRNNQESNNNASIVTSRAN